MGLKGLDVQDVLGPVGQRVAAAAVEHLGQVGGVAGDVGGEFRQRAEGGDDLVLSVGVQGGDGVLVGEELGQGVGQGLVAHGGVDQDHAGGAGAGVEPSKHLVAEALDIVADLSAAVAEGVQGRAVSSMRGVRTRVRAEMFNVVEHGRGFEPCGEIRRHAV